MVGFAEMTAPRSNLERPKSSNNLNLGIRFFSTLAARRWGHLLIWIASKPLALRKFSTERAFSGVLTWRSWEDEAMAPCFENPKESTNRLTMKEEVEEGKAVPSLMREEGEVREEGLWRMLNIRMKRERNDMGNEKLGFAERLGFCQGQDFEDLEEDHQLQC
ncbi:hypothetical protein AMTR_s00010p00236550 [Amborella trichopoda]|uniref:Uncharacterized protein n=1 Tax=Amborella trichopoda TaxID=13333 RepID=W1NGI4_AMBTC|nr:hypothetical protein AMTR_s00010p00236550 [Amborella trichopoda]